MVKLSSRPLLIDSYNFVRPMPVALQASGIEHVTRALNGIALIDEDDFRNSASKHITVMRVKRLDGHGIVEMA